MSAVIPTPRSVDQNGPTPFSYLPASSLTPHVMLSADAVAAPIPRTATQADSAAANFFTVPFRHKSGLAPQAQDGRLSHPTAHRPQ